MGHETTCKAVLLHGTLPSLSNACATHIDHIASIEDVTRVQLLAQDVRRHTLQAELLQMPHGQHASFGAVSNLGFGNLVVLYLVVSHLYRVVSVSVFGLDLHSGENIGFRV